MKNKSVKLVLVSIIAIFIFVGCTQFSKIVGNLNSKLNPTGTATITPRPTKTTTPTKTQQIAETQCSEKIVFDYPVDGQTIDYGLNYLFRVEPVTCSTEYLWGFFQNDVLVWENLRDEGTLSSNEYEIFEDSSAQDVFEPGEVKVVVRYLLSDGNWSESSEITITLRPQCTGEKIVFDYPVDGQTIDYGSNYLFRVEPVACATEYLWGFFQNDVLVWENLRDEGILSSNEYGILEGTSAQDILEPGETKVMVRYLLPTGNWSEATEITIYLQPK